MPSASRGAYNDYPARNLKLARTIAILNFKGGTGKTTTAINLGMALALRGKRVLLVDLDSQGALATSLGLHPAHTLTALLLGQREVDECIIRARALLDVIASDDRLARIDKALHRREIPELALGKRLRAIEDRYDFILLDCAPTATWLSESALYAAREVFVPVSMEYLALVGARQVIIEVLRTRRLRPKYSTFISLVIPTFYDKRLRKTAEAMRILERYFPGAVSPPIRITVRLSEAPSHHQTIFEYDPGGRGAEDYNRLAERVLNNA